MNERTYRISGKIINSKSRVGLGNLRIEAWDKDFIFNDRLGSAESDGTGNFSIGFNKSYFSDLFLERYPDIFFKIYQNGELAYTSRNSILWNVSKTELNIDIEVDIQPDDTNPDESSPLRVYGSVLDNQGKPVKYATVQAFDYDLRTKQLLNQTKTDAEGRYEITYDRQKFNRAEKDTADIQVHVFNDTNELLAQSATLFNVPSDIEINLVISNRENISEWERITQTIMPLLDEQGSSGANLSPWELNNADIDFIVGDTQIDREQLRLWVTAAQMSHEVILLQPTSLPSNSTVDNTEWILFYGWFRDGQPQNFAELLHLGSSTLLSSLERAIEQHYIPEIIAELKVHLQTAIDARQITEALKPAPEGQPASFGDIFISMPQFEQLKLSDPHGLGAQIVSVLLQKTPSLEIQWQRIDDLVGDKPLFNAIQRSVGLMQLTDGYHPLIKVLQLSEVDETAASLADLVKQDTSHWIALAKDLGTPSAIVADTDEVRYTLYGRQIAQKIELMHPSPYINHRVLTKQIPVAEENQELLTTFLSINPTMRIKDSSVLVWLESDKVKLGGLSNDQVKQVTPELLRIERIAKLAPSLEYVGPLLKNGYESARDIVYKYDRDTFVHEVRDFIIDRKEAEQTYNVATSVVATTEALVLTYSPRFEGINLPVIPPNNPIIEQAPKNLVTTRSLTQSANIQRLFGNQDYCECAHGASLYGPSAYLADLLHMLNRRQNAAGKTVLSVLLERRPDIAEIDLTADNADITLPYIDLVLEILETPDWEVGVGFRVNRSSNLDSILDSGVLPRALANDIAAWGISLSDDSTVTRGGKITNSGGALFDSWLIRNQQSGFKLRLIGAVFTAYRFRVYPQSIATETIGYRPWSARLSALVRNVGEARFPWKLPFDIVRDEANTWLAYQGATRAELMQALFSDNPWNDRDIACEYLNISSSERRIFNSAPSEEHKNWGFKPIYTTLLDSIFDPIAGIDRQPILPNQPWHVFLKNVSLLRSRAQLTHRELLNILETRFVRAGGIRFEITGNECNPAEMRLENMNATLAHRIHIFVRLWRKLGWTTRDLDQAINAYGIGTNVSGYDVFTDSFLLFLANIVRLQKTSKLSIPQLLDLFGSSLDTTEYWDHTGKLPQRTLSRYQQWFDNSTLGKPQKPEFLLSSNRNNLATIAITESALPKVRISDHAAYIAAALTIPESVLQTLLPHSTVFIPPSKISTEQESTIEIGSAIQKDIEIIVGFTIGATFSLLIQSSEDGNTFINVPTTDLPAGTQNPITISSPPPVLRRLRYSGTAKYLRCKVTPPSSPNASLWISVRMLTTLGLVNDELSLANLTVLCRYALLSRLIGESINDIQILMNLSGNTALREPDKVLDLCNARHVLSTLGLSINQADQLLRGSDESAEIILNKRAQALLSTIRTEAQAIWEESTVSENKLSSLLKTVLTGLGWNERLITDVLGSEGLGSHIGDYEASLDVMPALPTSVTLPQSITHDASTKRLTVSRTILPSVLQHDLKPILSQVADNLLTALQVLYDEATRRVILLESIQAWLRAKKLPTHRVALTPEPVLKSDLPAEWKGRFYYDPSSKELCVVGWITEADKTILKSFEGSSSANSLSSAVSIVSTFATKIDLLYNASRNYSASSDNQLIAVNGLTIENLLLDTDGLEARCSLLLAQLLPEWRQQKLRIKLSSILSQELSITLESAEALLTLSCSAETQKSFEELLTDTRLLFSATAIIPTRSAFESAFDAAIRLLTLGVIVSLHKMDATQVSWLGGVWTDLNLTALPTQRIANAAANNWIALVKLSSLIALSNQSNLGVLGLQKILAMAPSNAYEQLSTVLMCSEDTLRVLSSANGFNINPAAPLTWFHNPSYLSQLRGCLDLMRQLNMSASLLVGFKQTSRSVSEAETEVQTLRQMVLGNSTSNTRSDAEQKVLNGIRQRRRDATVDYLVQAKNVLDANDLYGLYLIDPQMSPCMMTSRIKQAISSVQLFIQRCLMNLEPDAQPSVIDKQHWEWMKNYRIWEANRKVLLYPENWIEPELRDDKTPFFDDVVSSLQQGDSTSDKAQIAVQSFLEKLTDLSRMDIVAMCSDYDDKGRLLVTHVFARTLAEPHTYWYRQFIKQDVNDLTSSLGIWTAWQSVDLDIEGDHLFPFVWQGRLFLFWAIFSEEAEKYTDAQLKAGAGQPKKYWTLKLAWSELKSGKWSSRKMSPPNLLKIIIPISEVSQEFVYFLVTTHHESSVTIIVYLPLYNFNQLISILYFDGNNVRFAGGLEGKFPGGSFKNANEIETPIDDPRVTERLDGRALIHSNMKIFFGSGGLSKLYLKITNLLPLTIQNAMIRSTQLLYSPNQGQALFSAPSPTIYYLGNNTRTIPFIQSDWKHQFFVYPTWQPGYYVISLDGVWSWVPAKPQLHFYALDWSQSTRLRKTLADSGIDKLLSYDSQKETQNDVLGYFLREYPPSSEVSVPYYPDGDLEFSPHSATAQYNWELFFHAPFSIACNLSKNQRFEEARRWFHYIFDPTDNSTASSPARYWRFRPFREAGQGLRIDDLVRMLADPNNHSPEKSEFQTLIAMWKNKPFQPHLVARMRIRSYMYTVVMKYLDNLIAWGDQLFRRDTLESLNEATQLYILAAQILGRRPEGIPRRTRPVLKSFAELLVSQPDDLSNALVDAENLIPSSSASGSTQSQGNIKSLYFCVPNNPKLLEYYDRVEDRLFKLRNCMNIDGVVRQLPLFEPAIDPSILVRAAAAGIDVGSVLTDLNAPLPFYRFNVMAQKATELCSEVKSLGASLLSAIEKGEAETLALMRSAHEIQMLQSVRLVKELQLHEAKANIDALGISLESAQKRFSHYIGLVSQLESLSIPTEPVGITIQSLALSAIEPLTKIATFVQSSTDMVSPIASSSIEMIKQSLARTAEALSATLPPESSATEKVPMNAAEKRQLSELKNAHDLQKKAMDQRLLAQVLAKIPDFTLGAQGWTSSPVVQLTIGGTLISSFANFSASILDTEASEHSYRASLHSSLAGYQRRAADWLLQAELAGKDIEQISKQIASSSLRIAIASQELRNHDLQIDNTHAVDEFMHSKYSNRELYNWMSGQLSNLHFQAYQLAYDVAKRAERSFKHELGVDTTFIKFGYWDNLKKGLLAGENLLSDIKRMEVAYLNQNARELEITKHISLRQLDPLALTNLRETGECEFDVPEVLFDLDFPGHYFRRIKSVSVSVPCVVGPYSSVSGTLTLLSSKLRDDYKASVSDYLNEEKYKASYLPVQSIATSSGQNDAGVFELNFRDERYLPFEGAGVISRWRFKLPENFRSFDYTTINDIVLHFRYTARNGGESLAPVANKNASAALNKLKAFGETDGLWQFIDLRHDYPEEWHRYNKSTSTNPVTIKLGYDRFPFMLRDQTIIVQEIKHSILPNRKVSIPIDPKKETVNIPLQEIDFKGQDVWIVLRYSIQFDVSEA